VQVPAVDVVEGYVLTHGVEMIPPQLSSPDQHQERQNKTWEVTLSSYFLPMLLHKQKSFLKACFKPPTEWELLAVEKKLL